MSRSTRFGAVSHHARTCRGAGRGGCGRLRCAGPPKAGSARDPSRRSSVAARRRRGIAQRRPSGIRPPRDAITQRKNKKRTERKLRNRVSFLPLPSQGTSRVGKGKRHRQRESEGGKTEGRPQNQILLCRRGAPGSGSERRGGAGGARALATGHEPGPRTPAAGSWQRRHPLRRAPPPPPGVGRPAGSSVVVVGGGGGLRGGAVQEPALLRGAAVGAPAAQPARAVAWPLGPHRRAAARGGPRRRLLRRRGPRQVRPAHGLHRHHALLGRHRLRRRRRRRRRVGPHARGHQVGHRLLRQGAHRALRLLGRGGGRRHGPLLLAAARGHDDVAAGVPYRQGQPGLRPRRRDRRRARRGIHRVPPLQPALLPPPPAPRPAAVRVRRPVPRHVRQQHRGGAQLLRVRERVPGRAAVGGAVAAPRHGTRRLPPLRRRQGRVLRRRRLGHDRVQLGRQVRRRPGPRSQAAAGGRSGSPEARRGAGAVQGEGGALPVRVPGPERRRQRQRQRGAEPRRDAVRAAVEQPPVRLQRRLPPHRLLPLPLRLRRRRPPPPLPRGRRPRRAVRPAGPRALPGGLHPGPQPAAAQLHGRLRPPVPGPRAPPRRLHRRAQGQQPLHRLHAGVRRLVRPGTAQPQRARRRHRRRAQLQGRVPGRPRELHADRGVHLQHGAHGRRLRQAAPPRDGGGVPPERDGR